MTKRNPNFTKYNQQQAIPLACSTANVALCFLYAAFYHNILLPCWDGDSFVSEDTSAAGGSCSPPVHVIPNQMLISFIYEGAAFPSRPSVCAPYLRGEHASSRRGGFVLRADWAVYAVTLFRPRLVAVTSLAKRWEIFSKQRSEAESVRRSGEDSRGRGVASTLCSSY